ncbi:MAG: TIGR04282 family arsenosugar biosynthesis glycosyltransferase [Solirubrobacteraceae bacterium]
MSGAILIMARAPRAGACKTRLEPLLGADGCAALQTELIRHTAAWACASGRRVWMAFDPSDAEAELAPLLPGAVHLFPQLGPSLGERLTNAVDQVGRRHRGPISVFGTDSPTVGGRDVDALELAVAGGWDACLLGAHDGGYAAITLAPPLPDAFALPPELWGGPDVLVHTLDLLRRQGRSAAVLDVVHDLDTPEDAARILRSGSCPHSVRLLLSRAVRASAGGMPAAGRFDPQAQRRLYVGSA